MAENFTVKRDTFQIILSVIVGGILIYAAIPKIIAPNAFYLDILGYNIIGMLFSKILAISLPWVELLSGAGIIIGVWYLSSLRIAQWLYSVFVVLLIITLIRGINTDCGCFGSAGGQVTWWHVIGDMVLLLITTFLISWTRFASQAEESAE